MWFRVIYSRHIEQWCVCELNTGEVVASFVERTDAEKDARVRNGYCKFIQDFINAA